MTLCRGNNIFHVIKKMSAACYASRYWKYSLSIETLKIIYFAHIHTIMNCDVIFWGNTSYAINVFMFQKKIIRITTNTRPRDSCRNMWIMTSYSQYIYSLLLFTVDNKHLFTANNEIHKYNTRNSNNRRPTLANLTKYNNGLYISGIKVFNHLPQYLKALVHNPEHFRSLFKKVSVSSFFLLHGGILWM
jgi:hypothetical protein